jgi:hypothetical protein
METSVRFFESGMQLMQGQGDLKTALEACCQSWLN